jgi:hypothetical protein
MNGVRFGLEPGWVASVEGTTLESGDCGRSKVVGRASGRYRREATPWRPAGSCSAVIEKPYCFQLLPLITLGSGAPQKTSSGGGGTPGCLCMFGAPG